MPSKPFLCNPDQGEIAILPGPELPMKLAGKAPRGSSGLRTAGSFIPPCRAIVEKPGRSAAVPLPSVIFSCRYPPGILSKAAVRLPIIMHPAKTRNPQNHARRRQEVPVPRLPPGKEGLKEPGGLRPGNTRARIEHNRKQQPGLQRASSFHPPRGAQPLWGIHVCFAASGNGGPASFAPARTKRPGGICRRAAAFGKRLSY